MSSSSSEGSSESVLPPQPHVLLFPFMAESHTIPLLQFARLLLRRAIAVTVVTTTSNHPFISDSLRGTAGATVIPIPFPGTESADQLPSGGSDPRFFRFAAATSFMQPHFDQLLRTLPRVTLVVSDAYLWWTQHSASELAIPRIAFYGFSCYSYAIRKEVHLSRLFHGPQFDPEFFTLTRFPMTRISKLDFEPEIRHPDPNSLAFEFRNNVYSATSKSFGIVVNSFYELESPFADYTMMECTPRSWLVGPFCLHNIVYETIDDVSDTMINSSNKPRWATWLDEVHLGEVLYVGFEKEAEMFMCKEQLEEIVYGLEESNVRFIWVTSMGRREREYWEERIENKKRGLIVERERLDDEWEILKHEKVKGFMSECGWNSVIESVCAGVPILGWPMMKEQYLNARMVEEEMKMGVKVETKGGILVRREMVKMKIIELMQGPKGREARIRGNRFKLMAKRALQPNGTSYVALDNLIHQAYLCLDQ